MLTINRLIWSSLLVCLFSSPMLAADNGSYYERGHAALNDAWDFEAQAVRMGYSANSKLKWQEKALDAYQKALDLFSAANKEDTDNYKSYSMSGLILRRLGRYEEAMASYRKALELNPRDFRTLEYSGEALVDVNRLGEAKQVYFTLMNENAGLAADLLAYLKMWLLRHDPTISPSLTTDEYQAAQRWLDERAMITKQLSTSSGESSRPWK